MIDQRNLIFDAPIIVIGDVIIDKYWFGDIERISPEAPVPILNFSHEMVKPGGAANVANNIANLGADTILFGVVGKDQDGERIESELSKKNIKCDFFKSDDFQTTSKLRVLNEPNQIVRVDFERENQTINYNELETKISSKIETSSLVVISDYAKGLLTEDFTKKIINKAIAMKKIVIVDPKNDNFEKYSKATILTPNKKEFESIVGQCSCNEDIESKGQKLREKLSLKYLLITLGAQGMVLISKNNVEWFESKARKIFDVTGAGDTVVSFLAAMLASGKEIGNSVNIANKAAGVAVGKIGAATVDLSELSEDLRDKNTDSIFDDVKSLKETINLKKNNGAKIVMTNGCFDLLHPGHISYLKKAKSFGDILVVAINSDTSVSELKGIKRPINKLADRAVILSSLSMVDYVISFDSLTPLELYKKILPDVLVKGGDYKLDEIEGAQEIIESGGKVKIVKYIEGYSSSSIVEKIVKES